MVSTRSRQINFDRIPQVGGLLPTRLLVGVRLRAKVSPDLAHVAPPAGDSEMVHVLNKG